MPGGDNKGTKGRNALDVIMNARRIYRLRPPLSPDRRAAGDAIWRRDEKKGREEDGGDDSGSVAARTRFEGRSRGHGAGRS